MKVLITGGAGFIGSHFVRYWLSQHPDDEVAVLDKLTYAGVRATVEELAPEKRHRFIQGDICNAADVQAAMTGCRMVVHFAAETHVDRSITNASPFIRTNVEGTQTLLHCATHLRLERFVHVSTDEVYGPAAAGSHSEDAVFNPRSPYAASKAAGDLLVQAYQATFSLPATVIRPCNLYGPRQFPEKFIPLAITNAMAEQPIPIYGDGQQRRNWLHVDDFCQALDLVIQEGEPGAAYNITGPWELANLEVATKVLRLLQRPPGLLRYVADRPGHDRRYAMTAARLARLGWRSRMSFDDGLAQTVAWYRDHAPWWQPLKARMASEPYHWLAASTAAGAVASPIRPDV
jgi:dTDP-glucose 4,6-dehydratase